MSALPAFFKSIPGCAVALDHCALLAITLGEQTGWAAHERNGSVKFGSIMFRSSSAYDGEGAKFMRFRYWLDEISKKHGPFDAVVFADIQHHSSMQGAVVYGGFLGQLTAWGEWRQIPYIGVLISDVRKHVIGSDLIDQQSLIDAMRRKGFIATSKETAGALAVLDWALHYKAQGNA